MYAVPGELQVALGVDDCNEIRLFRPAQRDVSVALTDVGLNNEAIESWRSMLWALGRSSVVKAYHFRSLSGQQVYVHHASYTVVNC